MAIRRIVDY